jgi:hypothetical protein
LNKVAVLIERIKPQQSGMTPPFVGSKQTKCLNAQLSKTRQTTTPRAKLLNSVVTRQAPRMVNILTLRRTLDVQLGS